MTDEPGPAIRRRQLGRQLRDLRITAGFRTMEAAAEATGLSRVTIGRIESAKQTILPRTVRTLCHAYGVGAPMLDHLLRLAEESEDRGWLLEYSETVPNWFARYAGEEADASTIWTYEPECVPGLLQTDEYMRAVMAAARPGADPESLSDSIAFRRRRQERLTSDKPPQLMAVINQAALLRLVGGAAVMRAQLLHLIEMASLPNVTLQALPFSAGAHPAMICAFTVLHFPAEAGMATIYEEVYGGAVYPDTPAEIDHCRWMFGKLQELALSPEDTTGLLTTLAAELNPGE